MSEDCHDSDNMPIHRLHLAPAHTCNVHPSQPCEACAIFALLRKQAAPYQRTGLPATLDIGGLDRKWLAMLHIADWTGDVPVD